MWACELWVPKHNHGTGEHTLSEQCWQCVSTNIQKLTTASHFLKQCISCELYVNLISRRQDCLLTNDYKDALQCQLLKWSSRDESELGRHRPILPLGLITYELNRTLLFHPGARGLYKVGHELWDTSEHSYTHTLFFFFFFILSLCPSVTHTDTQPKTCPQVCWSLSHARHTSSVSWPTPISSTQDVRSAEPHSPVSTWPITHECLSRSTWCISLPPSVFTSATFKEASRELGGRERNGERHRKREDGKGEWRRGGKKTRGSRRGGREGGWEPDIWAWVYLSCQIIWQALQGGVYN